MSSAVPTTTDGELQTQYGGLAERSFGTGGRIIIKVIGEYVKVHILQIFLSLPPLELTNAEAVSRKWSGLIEACVHSNSEVKARRTTQCNMK